MELCLVNTANSPVLRAHQATPDALTARDLNGGAEATGRLKDDATFAGLGLRPPPRFERTEAGHYSLMPPRIGFGPKLRLWWRTALAVNCRREPPRDI